MKHLHIIAEGQTEEEFVRKVLTPHLAGFGVYVVCQRVHTGGTKTHPIKGGLGRVPKYRPISRALERWVEADRNREDVYYSTMLDLYAFPKDSESPYTEEIRSVQDEYVKIERLEAAMSEKHQNPRFIPYVQLHEFETLMLADLDRLKIMYPDRKTYIDRLKREIGDANIELINGGQNTAPSKRIIVATPDYEDQKSSVGPIVVEDIGIHTIKEKCRHFDEWVTRLEELGVD
ncbi:MAG: DUF4276 family protein [Cytophagales bacterium]|nr:DUF4276 family protein [Cytophagales bacterium]